MDNQFTVINKEYVKGDLKLTSNELTIMILLCQTKTLKNQSIFTLKYLMEQLGYETGNISRTQDKIKKILIQLEKDGILRYYNTTLEKSVNNIKANKIGRNDLIFATDDIEPTEFVMLYDKDIKAIIDYSNNHKADLYKLLHMYTYICSCINNNKQDENYKLCYMTLNTLIKEMEMSNNTILKYLDILDEELKIIKHDYAGYKYRDKNGIKCNTTHFCRYEDGEILNTRLRKIRQENNLKVSTVEERNKVKKKISIKGQITRLEKKEKYNILTEKDIDRLSLLREEYKKLKTIH